MLVDVVQVHHEESHMVLELSKVRRSAGEEPLYQLHSSQQRLTAPNNTGVFSRVESSELGGVVIVRSRSRWERGCIRFRSHLGTEPYSPVFPVKHPINSVQP